MAMVAHSLAIIANHKFGQSLSPDRAATVAIFHDASEIITGDLPTPVKYFNKEIEAEYKKIEAIAENRLLEMVPEEFKQEYASLLTSEHADIEYKVLVKSADTICAYLKCLEEDRAGYSLLTILNDLVVEPKYSQEGFLWHFHIAHLLHALLTLFLLLQ
ncbi:hypothetical protein KT99_03524 [Shewanella benthica KT99]|uniref:HD domain-containing protein n=1 Tax=Shewanella benthica KT99 TaxID=314608 RepID=A9DKX9_9GAMM|nr:hypothetical protein KT99_03524 [Shewanella benthica KT99]